MADEKSMVPDSLPAGFASVKPSVNEEAYKYTIYLKDGNYYAITSAAKMPVEVFERMFCDRGKTGAIPRHQIVSLESEAELFFYVFPECILQISPNTLESIEAGWPPDNAEYLEEEEDDEEEEEEHRPSRRKPRKPW